MLGVKSAPPCWARKAPHRARREKHCTVLGVTGALSCWVWKALYGAGRERHPTVLGAKSTATGSSPRAKHPGVAVSHQAPWNAFHIEHPGVLGHTEHPGAPFTPSTLELPFTSARCGAADESMCRDGSLGRGSRCDARKSGNSPQHSHSKTPCASQRVLAHRSGRRQYGHGSGSDAAEVVKGPAVNAGTAPSRW